MRTLELVSQHHKASSKPQQYDVNFWSRQMHIEGAFQQHS